MRFFATSVLALALLLSSKVVVADFYQEGAFEWNYRAPVSFPSSSAPGNTIVVDIDFDALIGQTTEPGALAANSIRIVKNETTLVAEQEFNDTVFMGAGDATGNAQGEVRFILEDLPSDANYYLYFDITANGVKPVSPALSINGTFEQATGTPTRWATTSVAANGAQNNESYATTISSVNAVAAGCSTGGASADNSPNNNGAETTGTGWHLLGFRDNCEDGSGQNEFIRLARDIRVPAGTAAGQLDFSFQVQAWDGIQGSDNFDWFTVYIDNVSINHLDMGVAAGSPALVIETTKFGRSAFSTGLIDFGWRNATVDLSPYAGTTVPLRFEARFSASDNAFRSWMKLDDVSWSSNQGSVGVPELDSTSVATFVVSHDSNGIYCLAEPFTVVATDATGNPIVNFEGAVTLDTQQGTGRFSLAAGNGNFTTGTNGTASYTYAATDQGSATFLLNYTTGPSPIDIDVFLTSDTTVRDDDSESALAFSPNGFTFTTSPLANPPIAPINTIIPAQVAATNFTLYVAAYGQTPSDATCGIIESYNGVKPLRFWQTLTNPTTGTLQATIDNQTITNSEAAANAQNTTFSAGQTSVVAQYPDVGQLTISASDSITGAQAIAGSTSNFVVKPDRLVISRIASISGTLNPAATTLTGTGFVAAGEPFAVDIDSLNANNALTPNFGLESASEQLAVRSESLQLPLGGLNGSTGDVLNGATFVASGVPGRYTNTNVIFDETGIISLRPRLLDDNYLGAGNVTRPTITNVGRFYPNRFSMVSGSVTASCASFTYMDEPAISLSYAVEAQNVAGNPVSNYSDDLYGSASTANFQLTAENNNSGTDLSARLNANPVDWSSGSLSTSTQLTFARQPTPDGPYTALVIGARVIDTLDSTLIDGASINSLTGGDCLVANDCDARPIGNSTSILYGRAIVLPAQGPEASPLPLNLESQFFNGAEFERNTADNCTDYLRSDATLNNYTGNLQSGETSLITPTSNTLFAAGASQSASPLSLSAPGVGNSGTVDLTWQTDAWLRFDWQGTGAVNPQATATFGGFRGHDRIIYWQEQR